MDHRSYCTFRCEAGLKMKWRNITKLHLLSIYYYSLFISLCWSLVTTLFLRRPGCRLIFYTVVAFDLQAVSDYSELCGACEHKQMTSFWVIITLHLCLLSVKFFGNFCLKTLTGIKSELTQESLLHSGAPERQNWQNVSLISLKYNDKVPYQGWSNLYRLQQHH